MKRKHQDLVDYWELKKDEAHMGVDWSDAHDHCWRCGGGASNPGRLERAHIIPDSLGGLNNPENLVLLCNLCHNEAPDMDDKNIMWDWIKRTSGQYYQHWDDLRLQQEYKNLFGNDSSKEVLEPVRTAMADGKQELLQKLYEKVEHKIGSHSGRVKYSTRAYVVKLLVEELIEKKA